MCWETPRVCGRARRGPSPAQGDARPRGRARVACRAGLALGYLSFLECRRASSREPIGSPPRLLKLGRQLDLWNLEPLGLYAIALADAQRGLVEPARRSAEAASANARSIGEMDTLAMSEYVLGLLALSLGDAATAHSISSQLWRSFARWACRPEHACSPSRARSKRSPRWASGRRPRRCSVSWRSRHTATITRDLSLWPGALPRYRRGRATGTSSSALDSIDAHPRGARGAARPVRARPNAARPGCDPSQGPQEGRGEGCPGRGACELRGARNAALGGARAREEIVALAFAGRRRGI